MGLDNGIILTISEKELPNDFPCKIDDYDLNRLKKSGELEVCYWRKCWGIRAAIKKVLHMSDDVFECNVEAEDIPALIREIFKFLKPSYWDEYGDSIWEYEEILDSLFNNILCLKWLKRYLEKNPNAKCIFYDSY